MSQRPSFNFYPGDWLRNANLSRCSLAAQGAWIRIICLMHDSDSYGILRWDLKQISSVVRAKKIIVEELVTKGVMKGSDTHLSEPLIYVPRHARKNGDPVVLIPPQAGPIWFSSRMVRDEYVAQIRENSLQKSSPLRTNGESPLRRIGVHPC